MKKTLIALAALGVVGAASAQVAISGSIAVGVQTIFGDTAAKFDLSDADINFSAKEDLGGGLTVAAATSITNEALRGGSTNANNTSLSISGGFGALAYANILSGKAKMGSPSVEDDISDVLGGYTTVNVFSYTTPEIFPGFKGTLEWSAAPQTTALEVSGTPTLIGNYASGPLSVYVDNGGDSNVWDVRVKYDAGIANIGVRADKDKYQELAITVPMGAITYGIYSASFENNTYQATGFNASYAMSKQTSLNFGMVSAPGNKSAAGAGGALGGSNYRLMLKKAF
ncbi:MAG: porin [Burkholderiaceae bacterium]